MTRDRLKVTADVKFHGMNEASLREFALGALRNRYEGVAEHLNKQTGQSAVAVQGAFAEVAEHLPHVAADAVVDNLIRGRFVVIEVTDDERLIVDFRDSLDVDRDDQASR